MTIKSLDYIITAKHMAQMEGAPDVKGRILKLREKLFKRRNIAVHIKDLDKPRGAAVLARIELGQWIADCECGGAEYVDPDEPIFFCFSCGNRANDNVPRPVTFPSPAEREIIERLVLERPVDDMRGLSDAERAAGARALIEVELPIGTPNIASISRHVDDEPAPNTPIKRVPLTRSWNPDETIEDLVAQNEPVKKWHEELRKAK